MNEREPVTQAPTRPVLSIAAAHAVHDTYTAFLPPLLPILVTTLGLTTTRAGMLAIFLQTPWLLQPFLGRLADRGHARRLVVLAPALTGVMMSLLGVAPSYGWIALLLLAAGFGSAFIHASAPALVGRIAHRRLGRAMGFWMVGGELGRTLGPLILAGVLRFLSLGRLPWLMIAGLVVSIWLHLELRRVPRSTGDGHPASWGEILRGMGPLLLPLTGVMGARLFLAVGLTVYLPLFLYREGAQIWLAAIALTLVEGAGVGGALAGGALSDRWGRRTVLAMALVGTPLAVGLFWMSGGWLRVIWLLAAGFVGLSTTPVIMAMIQETQPGHRAVANGIYMVLNYGMRSLAVLSMGLLGDAQGPGRALLVAAGISVAGVPLLRFLPGSRTPDGDGNPHRP